MRLYHQAVSALLRLLLNHRVGLSSSARSRIIWALMDHASLIPSDLRKGEQSAKSVRLHLHGIHRLWLWHRQKTERVLESGCVRMSRGEKHEQWNTGDREKNEQNDDALSYPNNFVHFGNLFYNHGQITSSICCQPPFC